MRQRNESDSIDSIPVWIRFKFGCIRAILWVVIRVIGLRGLYFFGRCFALCEWAINYKRRRRFHAQMGEIFNRHYDSDLMRLACRRYFIRTRCDKFFYLLFDLLSREQICERIHFSNRPILDTALARGKGVYVALSHNGSQHVAGLLMCFLGYRTAGVRDRNEGALRQYVQRRYAQRFEELRAARMFFADSFPRDLFRWFQENGILGSSLDVDRERESHLKRMAVEFFGETRLFLTGTMQIALRCGASIHQGFVVSLPNFHYRLELSPPLVDPDASHDEGETLSRLMQIYAGNIETHLRQNPDHLSRL